MDRDEGNEGLGVGSGDPSGENIFAREEEEREHARDVGIGIGTGDPAGENILDREETPTGGE
jgi:hypothetical protein